MKITERVIPLITGYWGVLPCGMPHPARDRYYLRAVDET